jgi:hypothetical protein
MEQYDYLTHLFDLFEAFVVQPLRPLGPSGPKDGAPLVPPAGGGALGAYGRGLHTSSSFDKRTGKTYYWCNLHTLSFPCFGPYRDPGLPRAATPGVPDPWP